MPRFHKTGTYMSDLNRSAKQGKEGFKKALENRIALIEKNIINLTFEKERLTKLKEMVIEEIESHPNYGRRYRRNKNERKSRKNI